MSIILTDPEFFPRIQIQIWTKLISLTPHLSHTSSLLPHPLFLIPHLLSLSPNSSSISHTPTATNVIMATKIIIRQISLKTNVIRQQTSQGNTRHKATMSLTTFVAYCVFSDVVYHFVTSKNVNISVTIYVMYRNNFNCFELMGISLI